MKLGLALILILITNSGWTRSLDDDLAKAKEMEDADREAKSQEQEKMWAEHERYMRQHPKPATETSKESKPAKRPPREN